MLIPSLLRAALNGETATASSAFTIGLESTSDRTWREVLRDLRLHRLQPLVWWTLKDRGWTECVPEFAREELRASYLRYFVQNGVHLHWLDRVLGELNSRGIEPVLLKGAALVNSVYPALGSRAMEDIDLYVTPDEVPDTISVLRKLGFEHKSSDADSVCMSRTPQVTLDLHHRLRIFDAWKIAELSVKMRPRFQSHSSVRILEPNAMMVHLVGHLEGHRPETGYILGWILDVALVLKCWGPDLSHDRLRSLAGDPSAHRPILRVAEFARRELRIRLPETLARQTRREPPLTLPRVLSSRRLAVWDLPRPKGWLRLIAHCTGIRRNPRQSPPRWQDLLGSAPR